MRKVIGTGFFVATLLAASAAHADITVGFITSLSGNGSSIGIPYSKGIAAAKEYKATVDGQTIKLIQLDDQSDSSIATRDAQKLVQDDKVDLLIGTASAPSTIAVSTVAAQLKVPMIAISPIAAKPKAGTEQWAICVPQPAPLLISTIAKRMKHESVKTVGYIGFNDAWGDLVYNGAKKAESEGAFKITTDQRYSRTDTSVTGQILKIISTRPDSVLIGGSGTQGALPLLTLSQLGYKGKTFGTAALVNADFVRVGGPAANGIEVAAGPVIVAGQLPDGHYAKKISLAFRGAYKKVNGDLPSDGFSAYSFDAWLIFTDAAKQALAVAKPGTQAFRDALRQAFFKIKGLAGTQGIYTFKQGNHYGVDSRSLVVMTLENGKWTYEH
ncbi:MAG: ABC transporter substrate-binding protein [Pseudolabrys sp.]|jgi:branched-chain amino acid transport system substrate-binding protein